MDLVEAGRPDMQFADLRLGRTQRRRSVTCFFGKNKSYSNSEYVLRLVAWKKDGGVGYGCRCGTIVVTQYSSTLRPRWKRADVEKSFV